MNRSSNGRHPDVVQPTHRDRAGVSAVRRRRPSVRGTIVAQMSDGPLSASPFTMLGLGAAEGGRAGWRGSGPEAAERRGSRRCRGPARALVAGLGAGSLCFSVARVAARNSDKGVVLTVEYLEQVELERLRRAGRGPRAGSWRRPRLGELPGVCHTPVVLLTAPAACGYILSTRVAGPPSGGAGLVPGARDSVSGRDAQGNPRLSDPKAPGSADDLRAALWMGGAPRLSRDRASPHGELKVAVDHGAGDVMDASAVVAGVFP